MSSICCFCTYFTLLRTFSTSTSASHCTWSNVSEKFSPLNRSNALYTLWSTIHNELTLSLCKLNWLIIHCFDYHSSCNGKSLRSCVFTSLHVTCTHIIKTVAISFFLFFSFFVSFHSFVHLHMHSYTLKVDLTCGQASLLLDLSVKYPLSSLKPTLMHSLLLLQCCMVSLLFSLHLSSIHESHECVSHTSANVVCASIHFAFSLFMCPMHMTTWNHSLALACLMFTYPHIRGTIDTFK